MKLKVILLLIMVVASYLVKAQRFPELTKKIIPQHEIGDFAPNFQIQDSQGNDHQLSDLRGKVILLDFWASWCGPCIKKIPILKSIYQKYASNIDFEFVAVSMDLEEEDWLNALEKHELPGLNLFVGRQKYGSLKADYNISSVPKAFLIDREGRFIGLGLSAEELASQLSKQFKQN